MADQKKELTADDIRLQAILEQNEENVGELIQLIIFKLGNEEYALNIDQIKEVVLTPSVAKIPKTPDYIMGVANIRGNVIAILDLERKFELKEQDKVEKYNYTLVLENDLFKIGILVREVPNTLTIPESKIDKSSTVLQYSNLDQECITGIVTSNERMIILVDMIKLMESEEIHHLTNI